MTGTADTMLGTHGTLAAAAAVAKSLQSCPTVRPHRWQPTRLLCLWGSPGKNTRVGCHFLLQGIFPTQGSNPGLLRCRQTLYPLSHQGSPTQVYKMYNCFFIRQLCFFCKQPFAIRQKVHLSQVQVSVGGLNLEMLWSIKARRTLVLSHCPCTLAPA